MSASADTPLPFSRCRVEARHAALRCFCRVRMSARSLRAVLRGAAAGAMPAGAA